MITYYTDGSASPNPGPGGFSVIRELQPHILDSEDGKTTNIRMEGMAIVAALKDADGEHCEVNDDESDQRRRDGRRIERRGAVGGP